MHQMIPEVAKARGGGKGRVRILHGKVQIKADDTDDTALERRGYEELEQRPQIDTRKDEKEHRPQRPHDEERCPSIDGVRYYAPPQIDGLRRLRLRLLLVLLPHLRLHVGWLLLAIAVEWLIVLVRRLGNLQGCDTLLGKPSTTKATSLSGAAGSTSSTAWHAENPALLCAEQE
jgi:hypothetical protein